jgi:hypothetical protein
VVTAAEFGAQADWPQGYPEQCPPSDATVSDVVVYRIVDTEPPTERDFLSHPALVALGERAPRNYPDECMAAGLSVFDSHGAAERTRQSVGPMRNKFIAAGSINNSGRIMQTTTKSEHHTWWRPASDAQWTNFQVVSE